MDTESLIVASEQARVAGEHVLGTDLAAQALTHVIGALEAARTCGDRLTECWALLRAAAVHDSLNDIPGAVEFGRQALALAQGLADPEASFAAQNPRTSLVLLADQQAQNGLDPRPTLEQALRHVDEAIDAHSDGNPHRRAFARTTRVRALMKLCRFDEVRSELALAREAADRYGFRSLTVEGRSWTAKLLRAQGDTQAATTHFEALLADIDPMQDRLLLVDLHASLHALHKQAGNFRQALVHHEALHRYALARLEQTAGLQSRILLNRVELDEARHQTERARLDADMQRLRAETLGREAHTDALTGLLNRRFLERQLPRLMGRAAETGAPLTAALIDIDHFKLVNDTHGHAVGDRVLVELAVLLRQATRGADLALRLGGEEFLLVLPDTPPERAAEACERLRLKLQHHDWGVLVAGLSCTVSIGLGQHGPAEEASAWLQRLDQALYAAKRGGRNRCLAADAAVPVLVPVLAPVLSPTRGSR
ncbi:MAG: GGDEF domain-containing protein [Pseudomonadota bacterium]|nr:GGDEF domain-containing protein [Pseudomonadota bacterium]